MHIMYMAEMYRQKCIGDRENMSDIKERVREVKSSSKVGKK